jgi:hypothetical protein
MSTCIVRMTPLMRGLPEAHGGHSKRCCSDNRLRSGISRDRQSFAAALDSHKLEVSWRAVALA